MEDEIKIAPNNKIFERLVALYPDDCTFVAKICDEILDTSGALLGEVRKAVANVNKI